MAADNHGDNERAVEVRGIDERWLEGYVYRGEGNANLVIALPIIRSVLRFRKINEQQSSDGRKRVDFEGKFYREIISKYLAGFVQEPEFFRCHPRDLVDWDERVEAHRPGRRQHKRHYEEYATKLPDYALLPIELQGKPDEPSFCIEIKPKQGFVPETERHLLHHCYYCLNQFNKLALKSITRRSRYCPCDLFSGDRSRLRRAIHALIESPQNNFIVFKNGFYAWGEGCECAQLEQLLDQWLQGEDSTSKSQPLEDLNYLIAEALVREFPVDSIKHAITFTNHRAPIDNCDSKIQACEYPHDILPKNCVLGRIFQMQKLNELGINAVYKIYSKYLNVLNDEEKIYMNREEIDANPDLNFEEIIILRNYMLFTTARDCSILMTFQKLDNDIAQNIPGNHVIWLPQRQSYFSFNVGITDVDPKSLRRIENHRQRTICALNSITGN